MLWQRLQELASVVKQQIQSSWPDFKMEKVARDRVYYDYNHTDACKHSRWTAKESYQFMYAMPWQQVVDFYSDVVNGRSLLRTLFGNATCVVDAENVSKRSVTKCCPAENKTGRLARVTYKIVLSYHGLSFDGWQKQPGLNTVQGVVEGSLGQFVDEKKAIQLQDNGLPIEGCAAVAGRTDKGVTAIQQVCSFYTWRKDVTTEAIEYSINSAAPRKLRVIHVTKVPRAFHPNFSAKWRRYLYIFPIEYGDERGKSGTNKVDAKNVSSMKRGDQIEECAEFTFEKCIKDLVINDKDELGSGIKPKRFSVNRVNQLLHQLEGKLLSYKVFARDTKASRNEGPATECFVYHARAAESRLPSSVKDGLQGTKVMCVELVANRFLRKMVRVLVATSIREAAAGAEEDALLKLTDATCRRATAPPAPPEGLCLVDVGYSDFDPRNSLIA